MISLLTHVNITSNRFKRKCKPSTFMARNCKQQSLHVSCIHINRNISVMIKRWEKLNMLSLGDKPNA